MNLPNGAREIVAARMAGKKPAEAIVVSFVGDTGWDNPHVFPRGAEAYDWRFLRDLQVIVAVKAGVDASETMRGVFAQTITTTGYPWIVDIQRQSVASLIEVKPMRLWHVRRGCAIWDGFFA